MARYWLLISMAGLIAFGGAVQATTRNLAASLELVGAPESVQLATTAVVTSLQPAERAGKVLRRVRIVEPTLSRADVVRPASFPIASVKTS